MKATILVGDAIDRLRELPDNSVHCCITSPPYYGLRNYSTDPLTWGGDPNCEHSWMDASWRDSRKNDDTAGPKQRSNAGSVEWRNQEREQSICGKCGAWNGCLGLEPTPQLYVQHLVGIFREMRRVLRSDGTFWLNIGDSYATGGGKVGDCPGGGAQGERWKRYGPASQQVPDKNPRAGVPTTQPNRMPLPGLKPKDLIGIPWMLGFALRDDGWWLRSDIIWSKLNSLPESVEDRPTKSHEYLFMLSKSERYFFDYTAICEPITESSVQRLSQATFDTQTGGPKDYGNGTNANRSARKTIKNMRDASLGADGEVSREAVRRKRTVWETTLTPFRWEMCRACREHYPDGTETDQPCKKCGAQDWVAHFAVFPEALIEPCVLAGSSEAGACPKCGAPWERLTEKREGVATPDLTQRSTAHYNTAERYGADNGGNGGLDGLAADMRRGVARVTVGWKPGCECGLDPVPCAILDPFAGSGTTGVVAAMHHRDFVGIELNADYAAIAERRIELQTQQQELFASDFSQVAVTSDGDKIRPSEQRLFFEGVE